MRLPQFIRANIESIAAEWETYARALKPPAATLSEEELRDHVPDLLEAIAIDIDMQRTPEQYRDRARGAGLDNAPEITQFARAHAETRLEQGYDLRAMGAEYRALRETVLNSWDILAQTEAQDVIEQYRFNQGIDQ